MTTCKTRSHNSPTDAPIEHRILRKNLHKKTQNRRQQHFKSKLKLVLKIMLKYIKGTMQSPQHSFTLRCDEEAESEQPFCQVRIYRPVDGCAKGNKWTRHCGHGCFVITGVNINFNEGQKWKLKKILPAHKAVTRFNLSQAISGRLCAHSIIEVSTWFAHFFQTPSVNSADFKTITKEDQHHSRTRLSWGVCSTSCWKIDANPTKPSPVNQAELTYSISPFKHTTHNVCVCLSSVWVKDVTQSNTRKETDARFTLLVHCR